jgi:HEAT repeat protein
MEEARDWSEESLQFLLSCYKDKNEEVRMMAADLFVEFPPEQVEQPLLELTYDREELVRTNACDSLCVGRSMEVEQRLYEVAGRDKSYLVRGYAWMSYVDVVRATGRNQAYARENLARASVAERNAWTKSAIYRGQVLLGEADALDGLVKQLQHKDYRVRVVAVRNLQEVRHEGNNGVINAALEQLSAVETSGAVRDALE